MVNIYYRYLHGGRHDTIYNSWSLCPSLYGFHTYYDKNNKNFKVGYIFTIEGITMRVIKMNEKKKPQLKFHYVYN